MARRSLSVVADRAHRKQLIKSLEADLRNLLPPGNSRSSGLIAGVPVQRYAFHYNVDGTKAFDIPSAAELILEKASK